MQWARSCSNEGAVVTDRLGATRLSESASAVWVGSSKGRERTAFVIFCNSVCESRPRCHIFGAGRQPKSH